MKIVLFSRWMSRNQYRWVYFPEFLNFAVRKMKRSKFSFLRFSFLLALAGLFIYSTSIQEIHYLFVKHDTELTEHCVNHLHSATDHTDCSICKIDLSCFVQTFSQFELPKKVFSSDCKTYQLLDAKVAECFSAISLRGPPSLAWFYFLLV